MTTLSRSLSPLVLLVEDDAGLREVVARGLARAGYLVASAGTRTEAVASARELSPDAVVMDVSLPDGEGSDAAEEIRRQRGLATVPVLFVTARPPAVVRDSLFPAPVLFKPFSYRQLVAAVRALLPQARGPAR